MLEGSPAIDGTLVSCDTDIQDGPDADQLGAPRPYHYFCDIGAIESAFSGGDIICTNSWNRQLRMAANCSRSETAFTIPSDGASWLCVNRWNGAARVSDRCTRSETQHWL